jgi:hypothetical protein
MEGINPIQEAQRYLNNAKELLSEKAGKNGGYYSDSKYIRMAGDTAWKGSLIALDSVFHVKKKTHHRVSVDDYKEAVAKRNKQLLTNVTEGYRILHLYMGYDGGKGYEVCKAGIDEAQKIIDWCEKNSTANV